MDKSAISVRVQCHAGHRGEEAPQRFFLGQRELGVVEVLDRWLEPAHRYFKLRADDGGVYLLRHDSERDEWELTMFDSGTRVETRLSST